MSKLFDPFGDFQTAGYLRNTSQLHDPNLIKELEHQNFKANLPTALSFLEKRRTIDYSAFLQVHKILFSDFYPWAGQDRLRCHSERKTVNKDDIVFWLDLKGLDGVDDDVQTLDLNDAQQSKLYEEFENKPNYKL